MKTRTMTIACAAALALFGCGGGGGGGSASGGSSPDPAAGAPVTPVTPPQTAPPAVTTPTAVFDPPLPQPAPATPAPYTLNPANFMLTYFAGTPKSVKFSATPVLPGAGAFSLKVVTDSEAIEPSVAIGALADGTFDVFLKTSATARPGVYAGSVTVNVCVDAGCTTQLSGAPFKLPYLVEAHDPKGGLLFFNKNAMAPLTGAGDWETFQGNAQHTGYVPVSLNPSAFNVRWKMTAADDPGGESAMTTIATGGGRLYVVQGSPYIQGRTSLVAYSEADGSKLWSHSFANLADPAFNPPAYANGRVYAVNGQRWTAEMFSFDAASGERVFDTPMSSAQVSAFIAPTVFNGNVYSNGGEFGGLFSFSTSNGSKNYFVEVLQPDTHQIDQWTPAFDSQHMYTYSPGRMTVRDPLTGAVQATIDDPLNTWQGYDLNSAPIVGSNGVVYGVDLAYPHDNTIVAFDTVNKTVRWRAAGALGGSPAAADGYLFAANSATYKLEVRREADGVIEWSWATPASDMRLPSDTTFIGNVLLTKNLVFVSTASTIYAIDRTSHTTVWQYKTSGIMAMSSNGILFVKGANAMTAFNLSGASNSPAQVVPAPTVPTPPVVLPPAPYSFGLASFDTEFVAGSPLFIKLPVKAVGTSTGVVYLSVVPNGDVIDSITSVIQQSDGSYIVYMIGSPNAKPGKYSGTLTLTACLDPNCTKALAGTPFNLPYSIKVLAP